MPREKSHIEPGTKVGLSLSEPERRVILALICLDEDYEGVVRETPLGEAIQLTLDEWDDFAGYIAAEANHTDDRKLEKKLDDIFAKIQEILDTHTDEEPPKTLKIEYGRKAKQISDQAVQIAEWTAQVLVAAEQLGIKNKPLAHFWLSPAQRDMLLLVPGISKTIKGKLAKERASFTLAEQPSA